MEDENVQTDLRKEPPAVEQPREVERIMRLQPLNAFETVFFTPVITRKEATCS